MHQFGHQLTEFADEDIAKEGLTLNALTEELYT